MVVLWGLDLWEADAKTELGMEELYWGNTCENKGAREEGLGGEFFTISASLSPVEGEQEEEKAPAGKYEELPVQCGFKKGDINCQVLLMDQAG